MEACRAWSCAGSNPALSAWRRRLRVWQQGANLPGGISHRGSSPLVSATLLEAIRLDEERRSRRRSGIHSVGSSSLPASSCEPVAQLEPERDPPKVEVASSSLAGFICQRDATGRHAPLRTAFSGSSTLLAGTLWAWRNRHTHDVENVGFGGSNPLVHTLRAWWKWHTPPFQMRRF